MPGMRSILLRAAAVASALACAACAPAAAPREARAFAGHWPVARADACAPDDRGRLDRARAGAEQRPGKPRTMRMGGRGPGPAAEA